VEDARAARPADLERCAILLAAALDEFSRHRGGTHFGPLDASALLSTWSSEHPDRMLLVGTFDSVVVGLAAGRIDRSGAVALGQIECCYVEAAARAVGVGASLTRALMDWFAARHCTEVDAIALPGDRSTKQLLEAAGFKTRLLVLRRSLR
jgi:ribosomal protein S18 acetylase RimI-like enzyme